MRWPSAKRVSKANDDFPEPDRPVTTTSLLRGMATLRFFRLLTRAFLMRMYSRGSSSSMDRTVTETGALIRRGIKIMIQRKGGRKQKHHLKSGAGRQSVVEIRLVARVLSLSFALLFVAVIFVFAEFF